VVLDFSAVPGLDTSAVFSLVKLRNYCEDHDVTLVFSGLSESMRVSFERAGFFGASRPHQVFGSYNEAVEWCEDMLLLHHEIDAASTRSFESWLTVELGGTAEVSRILAYLQRHELDTGEVLFRKGQSADSVEILESGRLLITGTDDKGRSIRLRRMTGHTIVGEMGFFSKCALGGRYRGRAGIVYRLTREAFNRMHAQYPIAAASLHQLIIRLLSDRLEFANRETAALL
jgi:SulP family sulfate permease